LSKATFNLQFSTSQPVTVDDFSFSMVSCNA
jgi:hypothetical protein